MLENLIVRPRKNSEMQGGGQGRESICKGVIMTDHLSKVRRKVRNGGSRGENEG